MDVMDAIHRRRSVRDFKTGPIERRVHLRLIDAAVWAPSAVNEQPWVAPIIVGRPASTPPPAARKEAQIRWIGQTAAVA